MNDLHLNWVKCQGGVWCKLNTVNLAHEHFENMDGVYIIWHGGRNAAVVYVGQGNIRQRLQDHRSNQEIQQYDYLDLFVTWASVDSVRRSGVEAYLADTWKRRGPQNLDSVLSVFSDILIDIQEVHNEH